MAYKAEDILVIDREEANLILEWYRSWLTDVGYTKIPKSEMITKGKRMQVLSETLRNFTYVDDD